MLASRLLRVLIAVAIVLWFGLGPTVDLLVDWAWFEALGHERIFTVSLWTRLALGLGMFAVAAAFLGINVRAAWRRAPIDVHRISRSLGAELPLRTGQIHALLTILLVVVVALVSLAFGDAASRHWLTFLAFLDQEPFGRTDPLFGKEVAFYVFTLPVLRVASLFAVALIFVAVAMVGLLHLWRERPMPGPQVVTDEEGNIHILSLGEVGDLGGTAPEAARAAEEGGRRHLLVLGGLFFLVLAYRSFLERYELVYSKRGAVIGAGYADHVAQLPAIWVMVAAGILVALALFRAASAEGWRLPGVAVGVYVAASIVIHGMIPSLVQDLVVDPNELELERPYLEHNIRSTREAYALDRIDVKDFPAASDLTLDVLRANPLTVDNIRIWDDRPLLTTYSQLQEIRLYYDFVDVDVDRYLVEGGLRQVMLSARELNYDNVPARARSWVNEHFQYTHGYGLTLSPVNVVTEEGLPELWIKDIPPVSTRPELEVTRPEIYYGELTNRYALVRTTVPEFDYPHGDENKYTSYEGKGGVSIGTFARRLLFAAYFREFDILLTQSLTEESRVLFRRTIKERLGHLAPFLDFDRDPYLVVHDGRLVWIVDGYTTTNGYPYSERVPWHGRRSINYIRNSVKAVVDAYDGTVDLYVADAEDPLIRVYQRIFEGEFLPMDAMPADLRRHVRYPKDFFNVQVALYRAYHMTDPNVFYNREDMWDLPRELYGAQEQVMASYYLIMKLPDEDEAEFILLRPFVPTNRDNMIAWLAARSDGEHYGRLILYQFPKNRLIYGPRQIESRIDQDPVISEQITLWSQAGSRVVRGNLLVIPIDDSLLYVEPLYLQAESGQLPELKRVIVSYENTIRMRPTLEEALLAVFAPEGEAAARRDAAEAAGLPPVEMDWRDHVGEAQRLLLEIEKAAGRGDWTAWGQAMDELERVVRKLAEQAGVAEPEPAPGQQGGDAEAAPAPAAQ